jgi:hypothetical protein
MSEVENQEVEQQEEIGQAQQFIDALQQQNFNAAQTTFNSMLNDKLQARLDAEKVAVAGSIFNDADGDIEDEELTDQEIENMVDDEIGEEGIDDDETTEDVVEDEVEEVSQDDEVGETS